MLGNDLGGFAGAGHGRGNNKVKGKELARRIASICRLALPKLGKRRLVRAGNNMIGVGLALPVAKKIEVLHVASVYHSGARVARIIFLQCNSGVKQINLAPGRYIIAVSGGVDSMVLLDILRQLPDVSLVVAHVDHGIRKDSYVDKTLVEHVAMSHNLEFTTIKLALGEGVSEDKAREARYKFLRHTMQARHASAIITAHHKDDVLETAILNMLRGTGWRGLSSLRSGGDMLRPLLEVSKTEIMAYAQKYNLAWREDSTNVDLRYARNYIRHKLLPRMPQLARQNLQEIIVRQNQLAMHIDQAINDWLAENATLLKTRATLPRYQLIMLPDNVAHEVLQAVLRQTIGKSLPRPLVSKMLLFAKVAKAGKCLQLDANRQVRVTRREMIVEPRENVVS